MRKISDPSRGVFFLILIVTLALAVLTAEAAPAPSARATVPLDTSTATPSPGEPRVLKPRVGFLGPPVQISTDDSLRLLIVLGDSLSDTGRAAPARGAGGWFADPSAGYWDGRFSNGYLWVDYVKQLHPTVEIRNQARAGSRAAGARDRRAGHLPDLREQTVAALAQAQHDHRLAKASVVIWTGLRDLLEAKHPRREVRKMIEGIDDAIAGLLREDLRRARIFVGTMPPLHQLPAVARRRAKDVAAVRAAVGAFNRKLATLAQRRGVTLVPADRLFSQWIADAGPAPRADALTCFPHAPSEANVARRGVPPPPRTQVIKACADGRGQLKMFFDAVHPSAVAHCHLAVLFDGFLTGARRSADQARHGFCDARKLSDVLPSPQQLAAAAAAPRRQARTPTRAPRRPAASARRRH